MQQGCQADQPIGGGLDSPAFGGGENASGGAYRVGGVIKTLRNNQLTLLVGKKKVRAELADDLVVKLEVSDLSAVVKGAKISVIRGRIAAPGNLADEVDVTLIEPLAAPVKKGRKPKTSAAERKAAKEAAKEGDKQPDAATELKTLDDN